MLQDIKISETNTNALTHTYTYTGTDAIAEENRRSGRMLAGRTTPASGSR